MIPITGQTPEELAAALAALGEPAYRARQVFEWIHRKRVLAFQEMTNLKPALRDALAGRFSLRTMRPVRDVDSSDTTRKYLFRLHDGRYIECVLIPASTAFGGERSDRQTLCVSSQVGCAYDCKFCASGLAGFTRNLEAAEIVEQVLHAEVISGERIDNLVFMGMGEPLANLTNVLKAISVINADRGLSIGARHITVSTSGLAPQIRKLADQPLQIRLALSLHGATDAVRERIMPVNRKYPLDVLFDALRYYNDRKKQKITFEYILIRGLNDDLDQAHILARRARNLHAKVNLIPYNTVEGLPWERPDEPAQDRFLAALRAQGVTATLRREKGHDINAACGQLRLRQEIQEGQITAPNPT